MKGFTLLELIITLTIFMLLCVVAIPSYQHITDSIHADAAIAQLYRAIQLTRSEAVKENSMATICPSDDGYHCQNDWSKGYVVFIDHDANGVIESDDKTIQFFKPIKGEGVLTWKNFRNKHYLQMTPLGSTNAQNGSFLYCTKNKLICRLLIISETGRLRIKKRE